MSIQSWKSQRGLFCCSKDAIDDASRPQVWVKQLERCSLGELLLLFYFSVSHKAGLIQRSPNLDAIFIFCSRYNVFIIFAVCEIAFIFPFWLGH